MAKLRSIPDRFGGSTASVDASHAANGPAATSNAAFLELIGVQQEESQGWFADMVQSSSTEQADQGLDDVDMCALPEDREAVSASAPEPDPELDAEVMSLDAEAELGEDAVCSIDAETTGDAVDVPTLGPTDAGPLVSLIEGSIQGGASSANASSRSAAPGHQGGGQCTAPAPSTTPAANGPVHAHTADARTRFPAMYARFKAKLTEAERAEVDRFAASWQLPAACPFVTNPQLTPEEKALLAGAMLVAADQRGQDCGDWVMKAFQYSQGDNYIARKHWKKQRGRGGALEHPEYRWKSVAWAPRGHAVHPKKLGEIQPGRWVMYHTRGSGHSILIVQVFGKDARRGTIDVLAMESGLYRRVNGKKKSVPPQYRRMTLNTGTAARGADGKAYRRRKLGSVYSIQTPAKKKAYERWLKRR